VTSAIRPRQSLSITLSLRIDTTECHLSTAPVTTTSAPGRVVALTFDDGPNGATTHALLDLLAVRGIRAVFCVVGRNVATGDGPEVLRRTLAEGHALGNHAMTYDDLGHLGPGPVAASLAATLRAIRDATGDPATRVPWFRAPNGSWGRTAEVAVRLGMQPLGVVNTIDDWRTQDVPTLARNLRRAVRPGELVVAHDGGGDRRGTVAAVEWVLDELIDQGWSFALPEACG
jgi:endo-1,4-beta-xylanase